MAKPETLSGSVGQVDERGRNLRKKPKCNKTISGSIGPKKRIFPENPDVPRRIGGRATIAGESSVSPNGSVLVTNSLGDEFSRHDGYHCARNKLGNDAARQKAGLRTGRVTKSEGVNWRVFRLPHRGLRPDPCRQVPERGLGWN